MLTAVWPFIKSETYELYAREYPCPEKLRFVNKMYQNVIMLVLATIERTLFDKEIALEDVVCDGPRCDEWEMKETKLPFFNIIKVTRANNFPFAKRTNISPPQAMLFKKDDDDDDDDDDPASSLPLHMDGKPPNSKTSPNLTTPQSSSGFSPFQLALLALMVLQNSATVLVGRYSQARPGGATFSTVDLVFMCEFVKMVTCFLLIALEGLPPPYTNKLNFETVLLLPGSLTRQVLSMLTNPKEALRMAPPALLYLVQNQILYVALKNLAAPVFQVTYQSKLVTTALVSVLMLNRKYHSLQWIALVTLGVGVAIVVLGERKGGEKAATGSDEVEQNILVGLVAVFVASLSSAFAGVYFEMVLKGSKTSLWMRNVQLAFISVVISTLQNLLFSPAAASGVAPKKFLEGFDSVTWTLVCLQAFGGLLVAAIVKYADNVVKGLATGVAVVFATSFSVAFLGTELTVNFVVGAFLILSSVWVFANHSKVIANWK